MPPALAFIVESWVAVVAWAAVAGWGVGRALWLARETTLFAPLAWALGAVAAVTGVELMARVSEGAEHLDHLRYLAAASTLCPMIAVLGAKRPQARAWQWIVLSLLVVLWLPSLQAIVYRGSAQPSPPAAWRWLMLAMVAMGVANYALTRFGVAAFLIGGAQALLLGAAIPGSPLTAGASGALAALALVGLAVVWATLLVRRRAADLAPWNAAWYDFRDYFGAVWALRLADRINTTARQQGWPVRVDWYGFHAPLESPDRAASDEATSDVAEVLKIDAALRGEVFVLTKMLLRRFVSTAWIARRWQESPQSSKHIS
jgi:hypothetical protein